MSKSFEDEMKGANEYRRYMLERGTVYDLPEYYADYLLGLSAITDLTPEEQEALENFLSANNLKAEDCLDVTGDPWYSRFSDMGMHKEFSMMLSFIFFPSGASDAA